MSVDWVSVAVLSALVLGIVNTVDSHLISKRLPSVRAYMLPVGIVMLAWSFVLVFLFPFPEGVGTWPLLAAIIAGILRSMSIIIMLYAMRREEVSRVIPIVNTYPIFVAIIAIPLLGEMLDYRQWLAIIIVVVGVVLISVKRGPGTRFTSMGKMLFLLIGSSLIVATAQVAAKYALSYFSSWNMYCFTHFSLSGVFLLIALRPHVLRELNSCNTRNSSIIIVIVNEILAVIGVVLLFWAMQRGPVSLVSTIFSSRPIFVFIYAFIISRVSPMSLKWEYGKGMLVLRLIAIIMIVGGITIIYLT